MDYEDTLISKKELLEQTGISYGSLYRWKRKKLIPEEWFIRKSTFTGQETFFPRQKMLERIARIKDLKEDASLDDLAEVFSPSFTDASFGRDELQKKGIVTGTTMELLVEVYGKDAFTFREVLTAFAVDKLLVGGDVTVHEAGKVFRLLKERYGSYEGKDCNLVFIRRMGVDISFLCDGADLSFDEDTGNARIINILSCIEELKLLL